MKQTTLATAGKAKQVFSFLALLAQHRGNVRMIDLEKGGKIT